MIRRLLRCVIWFFAASWTSGPRGVTVVSTIPGTSTSGFRFSGLPLRDPCSAQLIFAGFHLEACRPGNLLNIFVRWECNKYMNNKKKAVITYVRFLDPAWLSYVDSLVGKFGTEIMICGQIVIQYQVFRREILHHVKFYSHNRWIHDVVRRCRCQRQRNPKTEQYACDEGGVIKVST